MSQDHLVILKCLTCKSNNYYVRKKRKAEKPAKLELKKLCKTCKKSTGHKEAKI